MLHVLSKLYKLKIQFASYYLMFFIHQKERYKSIRVLVYICFAISIQKEVVYSLYSKQDQRKYKYIHNKHYKDLRPYTQNRSIK